MTPVRLALGWSAFVLLLSTIPGTAFTPPPFDLIGPDKVAHALLFVGVGALWARAYPNRLWTVFLGGIAFGIGVEIWQGLLPIGRSPEVADAVADAIGLAVGIGAGRVRASAK